MTPPETPVSERPASETPASDTTPLDLDGLESELLHAIDTASDLDKIEEVRVGAFGRKGRIPALMQEVGALPADARKASAKRSTA